MNSEDMFLESLRANESWNGTSEDYIGPIENFNELLAKRDSFFVILPITLIYGIIFISGFVGNISTCIVISRNKSMHTSTNYYLFSLAVSDFMLLVSGVPMELYHIWYKNEFIFGDNFCILRNFGNELSANATVLTITAFTIERYFAICHPFLSHTMSKLSRAVKFIFLIWILSITFAIPQAVQTGVVHANGGTWCTLVDEKVIIRHSFELATILFFFAPMTLITALYMLIGMKLRSSTLIKRENGSTVQRNNNVPSNVTQTNQSTRRVIKMLVAVVICFFVSWCPFHAQRLVYLWAMNSEYMNDPFVNNIFVITTYTSGILYYVSTCINPVLYNIMSHKFREAFKETIHKKCCTCSSAQANNQKREYRMLSRAKRRYGQPESSEYSGSGKDDFSSSTQKQSYDGIAVSRNTSVKQHSINKTHPDSIILSPSTITLATSKQRSCELNDIANCHACSSTKITNSKINIVPDCNINEIHLNIFPQSTTHVKEASTNGCKISQQDVEPQAYLNIDIHSNRNPKHFNGTKHKRKSSMTGNFSQISFKRSDSILHISIGNSSKIAKRSKRKLGFLSRIWNFSQKRNSFILTVSKSDADINNDSTYNINEGGLNVVNKDLMIQVNKMNHVDNFLSKSDLIKGTTKCSQRGHLSELHVMERNLMKNFLKCDTDVMENGDNELDYYMKEIKMREQR